MGNLHIPQKQALQYPSLPHEGETTVRGYLNSAKRSLSLLSILQEH